ncbi:2-C-methyl-D-erythritol 2,4-cyclodiphosphate synthase [Rubricoccus marinus]|uniref:2-C-methyl-D-erythritol 2,4-cyclodiphosphate synthase n=1 Tax=Rubricoccus marinus TaxID=716817 RepID=A0A259TWY6_9BACT|nr:2-C-methyl-D-erythritol 2,4-cyclodiphosphate synthase [Rubricoccus marinus]OZC02279.1 2-C-methyl-D-erythritol 2,4-cyclodiphosphate synthase [Rubricoccus marinus]
MRIGHGYDVHRLKEGRRLVLGGVEIPSEVGLDGHSDADVLAHAITDALLGAAAMGDIGAHFPDTDAEWKDADSIGLLREIVRRIGARGWRVGNVDSTVVLQAPKLRPHIDTMRQRLADAMGVDLDAVSVKATTGEGMGWVGSGEGAAAHAVALLLPQYEGTGASGARGE